LHAGSLAPCVWSVWWAGRAAHNLVQAKAGGDDFTVRVARFTVVGNELRATADGTPLPTWTAYAN
jgi:hypothetical protein